MGNVLTNIIPDTDPPEKDAETATGKLKKQLYENMLQQAARDGDYEELQLYIGDNWLKLGTEEERPDPDAVDIQFGQAALANAAEGAAEDEDSKADPPVNFTECVRLLLETQHGPMESDGKGGERPKFRVNLIKRDKELETALMSACISGNLATVKYLIKKTIEYDKSPENKEKRPEKFKQYTHLDDQDDDGRTALIYAAKELHPDCCTALIENRADVMIKSYKGRTAYDYVQKVISDAEKLDPENVCKVTKAGAKRCMEILLAEEKRIKDEEEALKLAKNSNHTQVVADLEIARDRIAKETASHQATKDQLAEVQRQLAELQEKLANSAPDDDNTADDGKGL